MWNYDIWCTFLRTVKKFGLWAKVSSFSVDWCTNGFRKSAFHSLITAHLYNINHDFVTRWWRKGEARDQKLQTQVKKKSHSPLSGCAVKDSYIFLLVTHWRNTFSFTQYFIFFNGMFQASQMDSGILQQFFVWNIFRLQSWNIRWNQWWCSDIHQVIIQSFHQAEKTNLKIPWRFILKMMTQLWNDTSARLH